MKGYSGVLDIIGDWAGEMYQSAVNIYANLTSFEQLKRIYSQSELAWEKLQQMDQILYDGVVVIQKQQAKLGTLPMSEARQSALKKLSELYYKNQVLRSQYDGLMEQWDQVKSFFNTYWNEVQSALGVSEKPRIGNIKGLGGVPIAVIVTVIAVLVAVFALYASCTQHKQDITMANSTIDKLMAQYNQPGTSEAQKAVILDSVEKIQTATTPAKSLAQQLLGITGGNIMYVALGLGGLWITAEYIVPQLLKKHGRKEIK